MLETVRVLKVPLVDPVPPPALTPLVSANNMVQFLTVVRWLIFSKGVGRTALKHLTTVCQVQILSCQRGSLGLQKCVFASFVGGDIVCVSVFWKGNQEWEGVYSSFSL